MFMTIFKSLNFAGLRCIILVVVKTLTIKQWIVDYSKFMFFIRKKKKKEKGMKRLQLKYFVVLCDFKMNELCLFLLYLPRSLVY